VFTEHDDLERMRLREVTVALEVLPFPECGAGAEPAFEHVCSPALPVVRHCPKESPVPLIESFWNSEGLILPLSILHADVNVFLLRHAAHIVPYQAFLCTCVPFPAPGAERTWHEEARFAAAAELAMHLRWGLARILRVSGDNAVRGLLLGCVRRME
jgi:hypothetical protein